jgi:hypothetical protein
LSAIETDGAEALLPDVGHRPYGALVRAKWRTDLVIAQQVGLAHWTGLLLAMALLSALAIAPPWGFIIGGAMLTLLAALLYRNARRRGRGIDGWSNALILAPFVASTVLVPVAHLASERLAGALLIALVVGGLMLFFRRLRRPTEPGRSPHHFRGASPTDDA